MLIWNIDAFKIMQPWDDATTILEYCCSRTLLINYVRITQPHNNAITILKFGRLERKSLLHGLIHDDAKTLKIIPY